MIIDMNLTSRMAVAIAALSVLPGCTGDGGDQDRTSAPWGPMSVANAPDVSFQHKIFGGSGTLRISKECVILRRDSSGQQKEGDEVTLVWRSGQVRWDSEAEAIVFDKPGGGPGVRLRDGDTVTVGGGGGPNPEWLAPPHPSCPKQRFTVHEIS